MDVANGANVMSKFPILFLACAMLGACVSPTATLSNSSGQKIVCSSAGFGLITGMLAKTQYNNCVEAAEKAGYRIESSKN
ncbi:hypothetical protein [Burkholderia sp. BCC0405]|uniref:hypothetical protein n=1 Tax=Burkholderia sp. BCC0405 TaxID=2676298 RepID=UPI00158E1B49|nr:hypothetical protein [Burkholderia sp. BCC0405]